MAILHFSRASTARSSLLVSCIEDGTGNLKLQSLMRLLQLPQKLYVVTGTNQALFS